MRLIIQCYLQTGSLNRMKTAGDLAFGSRAHVHARVCSLPFPLIRVVPFRGESSSFQSADAANGTLPRWEKSFTLTHLKQVSQDVKNEVFITVRGVSYRRNTPCFSPWNQSHPLKQADAVWKTTDKFPVAPKDLHHFPWPQLPILSLVSASGLNLVFRKPRYLFEIAYDLPERRVLPLLAYQRAFHSQMTYCAPLHHRDSSI